MFDTNLELQRTSCRDSSAWLSGSRGLERLFLHAAELVVAAIATRDGTSLYPHHGRFRHAIHSNGATRDTRVRSIAILHDSNKNADSYSSSLITSRSVSRLERNMCCSPWMELRWEGGGGGLTDFRAFQFVNIVLRIPDKCLQ
jgi:hypothetical protein